MAFGVLVGLPSLRLRADYFAIVTIAMAEMVRLFAQNARGLTGRQRGPLLQLRRPIRLLRRTPGGTSRTTIHSFVANFWSDPDALFPLLLVVWVTVGDLATVAAQSPAAHAVGTGAAGDPRGRGRRPRARQEHPRLQAPVAGDLGRLGAIAGFFLALYLATIHPHDFEPLVTFFAYGVLVLGGLASYWGVAVGAILFWILLEGTRFIDLPISVRRRDRGAALRDRRPGADPADGLPAAGPVRQARGDGPR